MNRVVTDLLGCTPVTATPSLSRGWKTSSADQIEIPHRLLAFAEPGTCLHGLRDTGHGTFLLDGDPLTDPEALEIMQIPDHEAAVEISIGVEVRPDAVATGG